MVGNCRGMVSSGEREVGGCLGIHSPPPPPPPKVLKKIVGELKCV